MSAKARPDADNADPARPARKKDRYNRFAWRDAVFADPKTPTNAKCLAYGIATFVNGGTGEAKVSTPKLAKVCGRSATWVRDAIPVLHNAGWAVIEVGSKGRGEDHCNVYRINPEKRTPSVLLKRPEKRTRGALFERTGKSNLLRLKSHFLRQKAQAGCEEPLNHSNHKKERGSAARSADDDRESIATNSAKTTDDEIPNQRAPEGALIDHLAAQKQPPPERDATALTAAANGADADGFDAMRRAQFQDVRRLWPKVRIDEGEAFAAFLRAMAGRRLSDVIGAVHLTLVTSSDVPWLSEALTLAERNLATTHDQPTRTGG